MTEAFARSSDPSTSHQAAIFADVNELESAYLRALGRLSIRPSHGISLSRNGKVNVEITEEARKSNPEIREGSMTPRTKPLLARGLIRYTGRARKPNGIPGGSAQEVELTEQGWEWLDSQA